MSAAFNFDDRVTVSGPLTKVSWTNPHTYLSIESKTGATAGQTWSMEGPSPSFFRTRDIARATVRELTEVLRDYGEERFAQSIARAIAKARDAAPIAVEG